MVLSPADNREAIMTQPAQLELYELLGRSLFTAIPFNVAVIDRDFNLVAANENFEEYFGEWRNRRCYEVYKGTAQPCTHCQAKATFEDGHVRVSDEAGVDRHGRTCHYVVHLAPLRKQNGEILHVIEMTTDLTETRSWQREYELLFDRMPCPAFVVDRSYRLTRANEKFREMFGDPEGKFCYEVCKRRGAPCLSCTAALTFADGGEHVSSERGVRKDGSPARYLVSSSPLSRGQDGVEHVIQMATDITQVYELEQELRKTQDFYEALIQNSPSGVIAVDGTGNPKIVNPSARELLEWTAGELPTAARLKQMLPEAFFTWAAAPAKQLTLQEAGAHSAQGREIPVRIAAVELKSGHRQLGIAAFLNDLREIKRLEQEKLDAERLAAVGQTVAGLAHTIKNLLMGLEGGMYMVSSGLSRGDATRTTTGWQMLQRNFEKTTTLVKDFLNFAKGQLPKLSPDRP